MRGNGPDEFEKAAAESRPDNFVAELGRFLWHSKKWWLVPIVTVLTLLAALILLSSSAVAPFIYTLF
jgi:hypothetical protein